MDFEICDACGEEFVPEDDDDIDAFDGEMLCPACSALLDEEVWEDDDLDWEEDDEESEDEEDQDMNGREGQNSS